MISWGSRSPSGPGKANTNGGADLRRICAGYAPDMRRICAGFAPDLRQICVGFAPDLRL